jgi:hypothetical protein
MRLAWDTPGERVYEQGVDRGVLYVGGQGYAWSGLVSVSESIQGGQAKPYYMDGIKYANVSASEEFQATIEAFSSPPEFAPCDGNAMLQNGLFATQQPRRQFDLSYRTRVGNDLDGTDHAYKIHLVYKALAAPSNQKYLTIGANATPSTRSWAITTLPPLVTGIRPTSHFVIDSRTTDPAVLTELEDILYGNIDDEASMPTVAALLSLFSAPDFDYDAGDVDTTGLEILDGGAP